MTKKTTERKELERCWKSARDVMDSFPKQEQCLWPEIDCKDCKYRTKCNPDDICSPKSSKQHMAHLKGY